MGGCVGTSRNNSAAGNISGEEQAATVTQAGSSGIGKNVPLRHEKPRWKSDLPLTEKQVKCKRDEFWDTAPAFDGRREIWDALKAAADGVESGDFDLAQAIVDGASITLPHGLLTDCYDELGTRYQLPVYCFSLPVNVILSRNNSASIHREATEDEETGEEVVLKVRLSSDPQDVKLITRTMLTIAASKRRLREQHNVGDVRQRWYYGGKLLGDKLRVQDCAVPPNHVVQCIVDQPHLR